MTQHEKLKPCAHCGANASLIIQYEYGQQGERYTGFMVACACCGCRGRIVFISDMEPIDEYVKEAIKTWNKRI